MDMTAFRPRPFVADEPKDLPDVTKAFHRRRFSDPVSDLNAMVYDKARLLEQAVRMVDDLGIHIISAEAGINFNNSLLVSYSPACDVLEGVEVKRINGNSHWCANRFGTEIKWVIPVEAA